MQLWHVTQNIFGVEYIIFSLTSRPDPRQVEVPANAGMLLSDQTQGDPRVQLPGAVSANTLYYVIYISR